ncbi:tRNA-binding protein [Crocinitomix catalasitica]|uniref:tRNA-binding protein n=1 Tax=Crocinitomix catalasitica TaxID=184607 RepID=UPI00048435E4|nr:tRNA-binding protein [Crocinitomix catalasitica]
MIKDLIGWSDFEKIDLRVGTIINASINEKAKKPAYILEIDFGTIGIKKSSAQITERYKINELIGQQIVAVVNFPPKQIAQTMSECLILGAVDGSDVNLLTLSQTSKNGLKIS